jgi:hypothetical protein
VVSLDSKLNPLKQTIALLLAGILIFSSCRKEKNYFSNPDDLPVLETCESQTVDPDGRSYSGRSFVPISYSKTNCGLIPFSTKSYWVYLDSIYTNGAFDKVQLDTLRFTSTWKTLPDEIIWWGSNINIGIPEISYANDSAIFGLEDRLFNNFNIKDANREFSLFQGDSSVYLTNFEDMAAQGKSIKIHSALKTPAGIFNDCVYFEKNARGYRKDQVIIKPGVGVLKYIYEEVPMGERILEMQKVMTLVAFHIE